MEMCAGKLEYLKCAVRNYGIFCLCFISVLIFMLTLQMHFNDFLSTWYRIVQILIQVIEHHRKFQLMRKTSSNSFKTLHMIALYLHIQNNSQSNN